MPPLQTCQFHNMKGRFVFFKGKLNPLQFSSSQAQHYLYEYNLPKKGFFIAVYFETGRATNPGSLSIITGAAPGGGTTSRTWKVCFDQYSVRFTSWNRHQKKALNQKLNTLPFLLNPVQINSFKIKSLTHTITTVKPNQRESTSFEYLYVNFDNIGTDQIIEQKLHTIKDSKYGFISAIAKAFEEL